ncbi:MAG: hypothetical protein DMD62_08725 [Gemmatimonadetes bacterium]|nr:MAG: hypothetical protein DMD62_08725 [Gemmatimonadota bacterium]
MAALPRYVVVVALTLAPGLLAAQDGLITAPVPVIEARLRGQPFDVVQQAGSRFEGDRTSHGLLHFADSSYMDVKLAKAPQGGAAFNNEPRYEIAAYALQKLFLNEPDYVVPPTVARMVSVDDYHKISATPTEPTFTDASSVLLILQYWTLDVTSKGVFDTKRAARDTAYARHLGDLNVFTYLVRQRDANAGNILISSDTLHPRMFSVDNGVTFDSPASNRGTEWSSMRVKRIGRATATRLERLRSEDLTHALGVMAQFERRAGQYVVVEPTANLDPSRGVRRKGDVLQLGLTEPEIDGVRRRLEWLVGRLRDGRLTTF